jgi:release factor glutamine methyltransferase
MIRQTLITAAEGLKSLPHSSPRLEAELLLTAALGQARSYLLAWPNRPLSALQEQAFAELLRRRLAGEPIAYILGHREFWSLDLQITPDVLIPRPETELLVELALDAFPAKRTIAAADLGTGSGAVAAALAHERPRWQIFATDVSDAALSVAKNNFHHYGLNNVETYKGEWCTALPAKRKLDLIVANPPYVAERDPHLTQGDVQREPRSALIAGPCGLDAIRDIISQAPGHLSTDGLLLLEHGFDQGTATRALLKGAGFVQVQTYRDLAGLERVSGGLRNS